MSDAFGSSSNDPSSGSPDGAPGAVLASSHDSADWFEQRGFSLRFAWGPNGLRRLAPGAEVVVIVDVLSFSTSVDVVVGRGAVVLPYKWHDGSEHAYGMANNAQVAAKRAEPGRFSLRPSSLTEITPGTRLVLPSPNGSALTFGAIDAGASVVVVGSLRNATAIGRDVVAKGFGDVAVIAAGERWRGDTGPLRPAVEDLFGAGAIFSAIVDEWEKAETQNVSGVQVGAQPGLEPMSPEARAAMAAFADARPELAERLRTCGSGRELIGRGFAADVELAADFASSLVVPTLNGIELLNGAA